MENISIDNSELRPELNPGWLFKGEAEPPVLDRVSTAERIELNSVTAMILAYCDGKHSVAQIIDTLCAQYPDAEEAIPGDVEDVLRQLQLQDALRFARAQLPRVFEVPEKSPASDTRQKLCIGMATYDDYDGVYFSVQAIRLYHPEVLDQLEILVIDNHPDGPCGQALKNLGQWVPRYRYIPAVDIRGTAVRDVIFREANADYVLCIDSHVMIEAGAIAKLLAYFESTPDTPDLLQGPLLNDDLNSISTHFTPGWREGMYGTWGYDDRGSDPDGAAFDIPMQGLGLFACRKAAWPGFNPRFSGFGGEEGYIHEKTRQAGGRTLCLPFLRWIHRFVRPMGTRYDVKWDDRIRNYMIGNTELGLETEELVAHFRAHIGEQHTDNILASVNAELDDPLFYFDGLYCLYDSAATDPVPVTPVGLGDHPALHRMEYIDIRDFAEEGALATDPAYRHILEKAGNGGYQSVLILKMAQLNDLPPAEDIRRLLDEAGQQPWRLMFLDSASGNRILQAEEALTVEIDTLGAVAVHQRHYDALLDDLDPVAASASEELAPG